MKLLGSAQFFVNLNCSGAEDYETFQCGSYNLITSCQSWSTPKTFQFLVAAYTLFKISSHIVNITLFRC